MKAGAGQIQHKICSPALNEHAYKRDVDDGISQAMFSDNHIQCMHFEITE